MAWQTYDLWRPPSRPSRSLHGSFSRRSTQPNLARFLSPLTCRWQASQTCPNRHDAKTPDRPQQRPQTRPNLCLNSRQLLAVGAGSPLDPESAAWVNTRLAAYEFQAGRFAEAEQQCAAALS